MIAHLGIVTGTRVGSGPVDRSAGELPHKVEGAAIVTGVQGKDAQIVVAGVVIGPDVERTAQIQPQERAVVEAADQRFLLVVVRLVAAAPRANPRPGGLVEAIDQIELVAEDGGFGGIDRAEKPHPRFAQGRRHDLARDQRSVSEVVERTVVDQVEFA